MAKHDSKCSSKYLIPNSSGLNSSLLLADTSGLSSPAHWSNPGKNVASVRKRREKLHRITNKSVQTDPLDSTISPLTLVELKRHINFLTEDLEIVFKYLESILKQNPENTSLQGRELNKSASGGDINTIRSSNTRQHASQKSERPGPNILEDKLDIMKEKLNQILECAFKIKNAVSSKFQHHENKTVADASYSPTGDIVTPTTQTKPVDTYVKFLKVVDKPSGFWSSTSHNLVVTSRQQKNPKRQQKATVKSTISNSDRKSSDLSLDRVLDETLNRRRTITGSELYMKPADLDITVLDTIGGDNPTEYTDDQFLKRSEKSEPHTSPSNQRPPNMMKTPSESVTTIPQPDEKKFSLSDYISTLQQVQIRSPSTKRMQAFSTRSKAYFDFDDYYEKLVNLHNNFKIN